MRLDIMAGLQAPFRDANWPMKIVIGSALVLFSWLLVPALILAGYGITVTRESAAGQTESLPEFNWVPNLITGGMLTLGSLVLSAVPLGLMCFGAFSVIMTIASAGALTPEAFMAAFATVGALSLGAISLGAFLLLIVAIFAPALIMRFAVDGQISSLFNIPQAISDILASPLDYLIIFLLPNVLGFAFSAFCSVTFGVGALLTPVFAIISCIINARLMGDYYRLCLN